MTQFELKQAGLLAGLDDAQTAPILADINGDDLQDVIVGVANGTLKFYKNTGTQESAILIEQTGQDNPFDGITVEDDKGFGKYGVSNPALTDIDRDGDLDLFIGNAYGDLYFYENTETPENPIFSAQGSNRNSNLFNIESVGAGQYGAPTFVDIDGDGDYDLFIGKRQSLVYYRNDSPETITNLNEITFSKQEGDFDADTNNGNPLNQVTSSFNNSTKDRLSVAFTDSRIEGIFDAVVSRGDGQILYYENQGTESEPSFVEQQSTDNPFNNYNQSSRTKELPHLTLGDIDGDGTDNVLMGARLKTSENNLRGGVSEFKRNKDSIPDPKPATSYILVDESDTPLAIADEKLLAPILIKFNDDDKLDILIGTDDQKLIYRENKDNETFVEPDENPFADLDLGDTQGILKPELVDIDADGDLDLFVGDDSGNLKFFRNTRNTGDPQSKDTFVKENESFGLEKIDKGAAPTFIVDKQGEKWAFIGGESDKTAVENYLKVFKFNESENKFVKVENLQEEYPFKNAQLQIEDKTTKIVPTFGDYDGDGDLDAIIGQTDVDGGEGQLLYFENIETESEPGLNFVQRLDVGNPFKELNSTPENKTKFNNISPTIGDFMGEGELEIFAGTQSEDGMNGIQYFVLTEPEPKPEPPPKPAKQYKLELDSNTPLLIQDEALFSPVLVDVNFDGKLDLITITNEKEITYYFNQGDNQFAPGQKDVLNIDLTSVAEGRIKATIADIDGDQDLDVLVGDKDGKIHFYENEGTPTESNFVKSSEESPLGLTKVSAYASPTLLDENNDGNIDWAFIGVESDESKIDSYIKVFKNKNSSGDPNFAAVDTGEHPFKDAEIIVPTDSTAIVVPEFVDWDNDGDRDAFLAQTVINSNGEGMSQIRYFENSTQPGDSLTFMERMGNENPFNNVNQSQAEFLKFAYPAFGDFLKNGELEAFISSQSEKGQNGLRYFTLPQPEPKEEPKFTSKPDVDFTRLTLERGSIFKMGNANNGDRLKFKLKNINITRVSEITVSFLDVNNNVSFSEVLFSTLPPEFQPRGFAFGRQKLFLKVQANQRFKINIQTIDRSIISQEAEILEFKPGQFELKFPGGITIELEQSLENPPIGVGDRQKSGLEILDLESVSGTQNATFTVTREANYTNEVYFYRIDNENGTIDGLAPDQTGYAEAALRNRLDITALQVSDEGVNVQNGSFAGGFLYAPVVIVNGTVNDFLNLNPNNFVGSEVQAYFVFGDANSDRSDHIRLLGNNTFGFEDLPNGGDLDFNDIVIEAAFA